jgi:hypothetical protein
MRKLVISLIVVFLFIPLIALADSDSIWVGGDVGSGLNKWTYGVGFIVGGSIGTKVFTTTEKHDLLLSSVDGNLVLTKPVFGNHWYGGNFDSELTLFGGIQVSPNVRSFGGSTLLLRYDFSFVGNEKIPIMPYIEGGCGILGTNIGDPDLSGDFQFNPRFGAGTYYFITSHTALKFWYDWIHFSCANMEHPNNGLNSQGFGVGVTWFFK